MRAAFVLASLATACLRPAEDRALADLEAGVASAGGVDFAVDDNLAAVREATPGSLTLWAQAPVLRLRTESAADATRLWALTALNLTADAELIARDALTGQPLAVTARDSPRPTVGRWEIELPPGGAAVFEVIPTDADDLAPWRFAFFADIQEGLDRVGDIYERINADPAIRMVVFGGDLTDRGSRAEIEDSLAAIEALAVPFYATIGNHELFDDDHHWEQLIGPRNLHFVYRGLHVSLLDSSSATIDPLVYDRLDGWLADAADDVHVVASHYPPFDPVGIREGGFRSRKEAAKLFAKLRAGKVDAALFGHIHSFYADERAGVPMYIAGGGGAFPQERLDGVGRHILTVDIVPGVGVRQVAMVRID
jgi:predicted phosphodiesterase